jgi:ABC-2 type transport system permease protein
MGRAAPMKAIFRREMYAYFTSPIGYIYLAVFFGLSGLFFSSSVLYNSVSDLTGWFGIMALMVFPFLIPLLTMRLMSEELRHKTDQLLITSPVTLTNIIIAKFSAAFIMFCIGMCISIPYLVIMGLWGEINWSVTLGCYIGALLMSAAYIALGLLFSGLTENQLIAAVLTYVVLLGQWLISVVANQVSNATVAKILQKVSLSARYDDFTAGILDLSHIVYYVSLALLFLFLSVRVLEKRRWS